MTHTASAFSVFGRLGILLCLSLVMTGCGFYLQGQSQTSFPARLNLYADDPLLASVVSADLIQHEVSLELLDSATTDTSAPISALTSAPTLQLTRTLKHRAELILDSNGDTLIWRYTLSSHYLFLAKGAQPEIETSVPISVTIDVDLSGTHTTINQRIEADSWTLLYQQLGSRITRQLSYE